MEMERTLRTNGSNKMGASSHDVGPDLSETKTKMGGHVYGW
jgi:hypothetical protein